jgi:hypothetical protein
MPSFVAFDHHSKRLCTLCDFTWLKRVRTRHAAGISDAVRIEEIRHHISLDCEVHILRQVINDGGNCDRIEFALYYADDVAAIIEKRPSAVSRLYGRRYLQDARVVS